MPKRQVRPEVQVPVVDVPLEMLVVPQQGWPMPPHAWQVAVDDWLGQYTPGAVQT